MLLFISPLVTRSHCAVLGELVVLAAVRMMDLAGVVRLAAVRRRELLLAVV